MPRKLLVPLLVLLSSLTLLGGESARPNVLFIMADDHTTQAFGVYGSRLAKLNPTPNIDRLAKEGMRFDRVFCNNSICVPSRASILTGQYPQTNGITELHGSIRPERQHLAIEMKKAGYDTAMIGKWHLSAEPAAFDCSFVGALHGEAKPADWRKATACPLGPVTLRPARAATQSKWSQWLGMAGRMCGVRWQNPEGVATPL